MSGLKTSQGDAGLREARNHIITLLNVIDDILHASGTAMTEELLQLEVYKVVDKTSYFDILADGYKQD